MFRKKIETTFKFGNGQIEFPILTVSDRLDGSNEELVESLGADEVIDYTQHDFAKLGNTYDAIMDTAGTASYSRCKTCLTHDGRMLIVLGGISDLLRAPVVALSSKRKIVAGPAAERLDDLQQLASLASSGKLKPVIDREYSVDEIVQAHRYVDSGRKRGSVVIRWK